MKEIVMSLSNLPKYPEPREIERALKQARNKLQDAIWDDNKELTDALMREIKRLELLKEVGERYDVDF